MGVYEVFLTIDVNVRFVDTVTTVGGCAAPSKCYN